MIGKPVKNYFVNISIKYSCYLFSSKSFEFIKFYLLIRHFIYLLVFFILVIFRVVILTEKNIAIYCKSNLKSFKIQFQTYNDTIISFHYAT